MHLLPRHSTEHQSPEHPSVREKDKQPGKYLTGAPAAWELTGTLETRVKRQERNKRNVPELYFLFFISYAPLQFWKGYGMGGQKTCLYSLAPLPPSCSPFHIFSYFLQWLFFLKSLFFFFFLFLIPPGNEISKAFLSSICASVTEGDLNADGDDEGDDASHNCHCHDGYRLWTCCRTLNPKVDTY